MRKFLITKRPLTSTLLGLASSLTIAASSLPAQAAVSPIQSPVVVEYFANTLLVQLPGGVNYHGLVTSPAGCATPNQSIDTLKAWLSLSQAALLSGKTVKIGFNTCGALKVISAIDLNQ